MRPPTIIGLTGYAGSGKTLTADLLAESYGAIKVSFATALKAIANDLPVVDSLVAYWGPEQAKRDHGVVREMYQKLGEGVRRVLGEYVWVDHLQSRWSSPEGDLWDASLVVIDDVRYPNEAAVCDWVLHVERDAVGPLNGHESEQGVSDLPVDLWIDNNGDLDDLREAIDLAMLLIDGEAKVYP